MTENRTVTKDELEKLGALIQILGIEHPENTVRFIDTHLNKEYSVYLIQDHDRALLVKRTDMRCRDKVLYDRYFAGHGFAVPRVYDSVQTTDGTYLLMDFIDGVDARGCGKEDAAKIGEALAEIQSHCLKAGGHTETAVWYFTKYLEQGIEKVMELAPALTDVWEPAKERFYAAPQTLVHDDLLPINVLIGEEHPWLIDWETAGIYPYFLDLARFAFVTDENGAFYISSEAGMAFLDSYYKRMSENPNFQIGREQFALDAAISALYQYIQFFDFEKPLEVLREQETYNILIKIISYLKANQGKEH